ncbi:MAG: calcium-binding protein, partial [Acidimicrobiia bacterium]
MPGGVVLFDDVYLDSPVPWTGIHGFTVYDPTLQRKRFAPWTAVVIGTNGVQLFSGTTDTNGRGAFTYTANSAGLDTIIVVSTLGSLGSVGSVGSAARSYGVTSLDTGPAFVLFDQPWNHSPNEWSGLHGFTVYDALAQPVPNVSWEAFVEGSNGPQGFSGTTDSNGRGVFQYTGTTGVDVLWVRTSLAGAQGYAVRTYGDTPCGGDILSSNCEIPILPTDPADDLINVLPQSPDLGTGGECVLQEGNDDPNVLVGGTGCDILAGYGGDDSLFGNYGHDVLYGHEDRDRLEGGNGDDDLYGHQGFNQYFGEEGSDEMFGGDDVDNTEYFQGGQQGDYVAAGNGDDFIEGHGGDDTLIGGPASDYISGGPGNDSLTAGCCGNGTDKVCG